MCIRDRVRTLHHIQIMFDDDNAVPAAYQGIEGFEQFLDVMEV